jgi:hypothetical protein
MAETVDELTVTYEEDGVEIIRELDKEVLSKGAWATVIFKYQDLDRQTQEYSEPRFTIRRYRKSGGFYRQQSKFNISSVGQAQKLIEILEKWIADK